MKHRSLKMHIFVLFVWMVLVTQAWGQTQNCYVRLEDASGINTDAYQNALQAAAAELCAIFDSAGFAGEFKVYDFGFYLLHQENTTGGYPEVFSQKIQQVQSLSPYYLLFGKQTDKSGIYTRFWVDLKVPETGKFGCIDLLSPTLRGDIKKKVEYVTTTTYTNEGGLYFQYSWAEKAAIEVLQKIASDFVECCDLQARNSESSNVCNSFLFPAVLKEVTYSGEHYIEMKRDGETNFGEPFPKPHFLSSRVLNEQSPFACVSGFNIAASTAFDGNEFFETVKVRGKGEIQVNGVTITICFEEQTATQNAIDKKITCNLISILPYMAVFLDDLKIKWEIKAKKAGEPIGEWEPVGESINDWYLTLSKPIAEEAGKGYLHFHTLFDISCRYGIGASDFELINGIWGHFAGRQVKRADGQFMKYYGQWSGGDLGVKTSELLQNKDGECTAWARLFLDVLKVHGFRCIIPAKVNTKIRSKWTPGSRHSA